jgi:predicted NAD-dependent protein-ADP-ribosyltransferase YbiA (DUF1768 family)
MVKSKIQPEKVQYKETRDIDDDDIGEEQSVYSHVLYDKKIEMVLGKQNYSYSSHNVIYFPIYLIIADSPVEKIGIFEIDSEQLINILDEDGDVDLNKGNVLFFSFLSKDYINHVIKENEQVVSDKETKDIEQGNVKKETENASDKESKENNEEEDVEDQGVTELKIPKQMLSDEKKKSNSLLKHGVFIIDENKTQSQKLLEETKEEDERVKGEYEESAAATWIEKYMENNNYDIEPTTTNGDCFFDTVRLAYESIGYNTTVEKLRAKFTEEVTEEQFDQYRTIYVNFLGESQTLEKEMKDLKKMTATMKKQHEKITNKEESKKLLGEANKVVDMFKTKKTEKEDVDEMMQEVDFMKGIDSLEKLKDYMMQPQYWADTSTVSTLERVLNMKVIILSEEKYERGEVDSVLQCGQLNDDALEKEGNFKPDYYVIATYSGNHYKLVTYKEKKIFKFSEVPYGIKALIIKKCMERNAGPYYLIKDFRDMKTKLGLPADEGAPIDTDDDITDVDLYDSEIVFMFHAKSDCKPKAGEGAGEKVPKIRLTEFTALNKDKNKTCDNWRRKLDDSWIAQFTVDGKRWASVEHYYLACQYKKGFPDFYEKFSLDSESDISKEVDVAKAAASKSGRLDYKVLRDKHIKPDEDYFEVKLDSPHEVARRKALEAKFTQNLDLKKILLETKNAKLMHFIRGFPAKADEELMKLRKNSREPISAVEGSLEKIDLLFPTF